MASSPSSIHCSYLHSKIPQLVDHFIPNSPPVFIWVFLTQRDSWGPHLFQSKPPRANKCRFFIGLGDWKTSKMLWKDIMMF